MRFHLIDALRGMAALWVVLFHAKEGEHIDQFYSALPSPISHILFDLGDAGVPIFFVISGFVITHSIMRDRINGLYFAKFTLRRSIRLDPPYWGSIVLVITIAWLSSVVKGETFILPQTSDIAAHMLYLQGILEIPHLNMIYWTLCLEIQFYLTFCLIIYIIQHFEQRFSYAFITAFTFVAIISLLWPMKILNQNVFPGLFLPHWHSFLLGAFAYFSWKKKTLQSFYYIYFFIILLSASIHQNTFSIAAALTSSLVHEASKYGLLTHLNWRWIQFLGKISYSLYLTHNPITGAVFFLFYTLFGRSLSTQIVAFGVVITACIAFAYLFWLLFESWSMRISKKIPLHKQQTTAQKPQQIPKINSSALPSNARESNRPLSF